MFYHRHDDHDGDVLRNEAHGGKVHNEVDDGKKHEARRIDSN